MYKKTQLQINLRSVLSTLKTIREKRSKDENPSTKSFKKLSYENMSLFVYSGQ